MPISSERKAEYGPCWALVSMEIREAANNRCQFCHVKNHDRICRGRKGTEHEESYMLFDGTVWSAKDGSYLGDYGFDGFVPGNMVNIVLTVAHLNHTPSDLSWDNLKALCQRCHLKFDQSMHTANAAATRRKKLATGDLFR